MPACDIDILSSSLTFCPPLSRLGIVEASFTLLSLLHRFAPRPSLSKLKWRSVWRRLGCTAFLSGTDGVVSTEPNLFELCRVATEEDHRSRLFCGLVPQMCLERLLIGPYKFQVSRFMFQVLSNHRPPYLIITLFYSLSPIGP